MRPLRYLVGLVLIGYGLLVVLRILAHDAPVAGLVSLVLGVGLVAAGLPRLRLRRPALVAFVGGVAVGGVLAYNLILGSTLGVPEWGLVAYGGLLLVAANRIDARVGRFDVGTLVAWSFPLLLAPLLLYALNGALTGPVGVRAGDHLEPLIALVFVTPTVAALRLVGTPATAFGNDVLITTARGTLTLDVGLICAGIYPMVLFLGVLALHGWHERLAPRVLARYLGLGLVGLYLTNLVRLIVLAKVGERWGSGALQTTHAHLGWALFAIFMVVFWVLVSRRYERAGSRPVRPRGAASATPPRIAAGPASDRPEPPIP